MKNNPFSFRYILLLLVVSASARAQTDAAVSQQILEKDSLFWHAYNTCNLPQMASFYGKDLEFYHDKGGITLGADKLNASFTAGPCNPAGDYRLRREALPGTVTVYPMRKADTVYGAVISGEHYFFIVKNGQSRREGHARFTHLWLLENGEWKMTRILSFDHGPAPYDNEKKAITLTAQQLQAWAGKYKGPQSELEVAVKDGRLEMISGKKTAAFFPESPDTFFMKERALTFTFSRKEQATELTVRENGQVVEVLVRQP
ncbi:nuclear transport factor 2 family protein [Chitinophaga deserti]|uniref:nuclear transport factor 2 family protein n=1 Tax=Chitinophaga deserti TaxID=2164099 RepID=UPI000D6C975B|nr:nuclear transport factor 2 family protein [Chitinophaga deserti]